MGGGRRRYDDGKIQNIYIPKDEAKMKLYTRADIAQPWEGLYWTTAVDGTQSNALHFWYEKLTGRRHRACRSVCPRQRHAGALREGGEYVDDRYARQDNGPAACRPVVVWYNSCGVGR